MKFTVIIPTIGAKDEWLAKAIHSCSFADEIIITREVGLTNAVNNAVDKACGDWISVLPDDDFFLPAIDQVIEVCKTTDACVVHFPCIHWLEETPLEGLHDVSPNITLDGNRDNKIFGSSFIRRKTFMALDGYSETDVCQDVVLWNKCLKAGRKFQYVPIPCGVFRWNMHSKLQAKTGGCTRMMGGRG